MATRTKAPALSYDDVWASALTDNKISADELKALKKADKAKLSQSFQSLIQSALSGDSAAIKTLGAYGDYGAPGNTDNPYLKAALADKGVKEQLKTYQASHNNADVLKFLKGMDSTLNKGGAFDLASIKPEFQNLAAGMAVGAGKTEGLDQNIIANFNQQIYDPSGKITKYGQGQYDAGLGNASDISEYDKQFYFDNVAKQWINPDNSLTDAGKTKFNEFWKNSEISKREDAMNAFMTQYNPLYNPPASTTQTDPANAMPTDPAKLNEWITRQGLGKTFAPMSQQSLDALSAIQNTATAGIAGGDRNANVRDFYNNMLTGPNPFGGFTAPQANTDFSNVKGIDYSKFQTPNQINAGQFRQAQINNPAGADMIDAKQFSAAPMIGGGGAYMIDPSQFQTPGMIDANRFKAMNIDPNQFTRNTPQTTAAQMQAPRLFASENQFIGANNPFAQLNNPYLDQMTQAATRDIRDSYDKSVFNSTDATMARAGAFGGSAWEEAQRRNQHQFNQDLGDAVNNLRWQNYNQAAQISEADLARNAGLTNDVMTADLQSRLASGQSNLSAEMQARLGNLDAQRGQWNNALQALLGNQGAQNALNNTQLAALRANQDAEAGMNQVRLNALLGNQSATSDANRTNVQAGAANQAAWNNYQQLLMGAAQNNQQAQLSMGQMGLNADVARANSLNDYNQLMLSAGVNNANIQNQQNDLMLRAQMGDQNAMLQLAQMQQGQAQFNASQQYNTNALNQQGRLGYMGMQMGAAGQLPGLAPSQYGDAAMLASVGDAYAGQAQKFINEDLSNFNAEQNWNQQQNDAFGNAIAKMGASNYTGSTTTPPQYIPQESMDYGQVASSAIGAGMSAYGAFGGGSGAGAKSAMTNYYNSRGWY